ncbi:MAG: LuxR C-terminal-related transcriptional regulator [Streptosporangiaceae bacterium]
MYAAGEVTEHKLHGRRGERETLDRLVASVRAGNSRALILRGEAGAGKTALLEYLLEHAWGCRVVRVAGVESEMDLPFAGLHQLCAPFLDRIERLPGPQRDALGTALSLRGGAAPDRFAVGLAVLGLLAEVAVARHLAAGPVAVVITVRAGGGDRYLAGLTELVVRGLADTDARALLDAAVTGPVDERVRDRIVAEARGNPRTLLEVARGLVPGDLAGGFGLPGPAAPADRSEEMFGLRLAPLPPATRLLLLVAAAEPVHDPVLVWRAAGQLGVEAEAAAPAAAAGLIESGRQIRFCHPRVRSGVYRLATAEERRLVHLALAEATDPGADPDRRAWHRAHAAPGLDEGVAAELEGSAERARARGGLAAAAAFRERAAELTPDPARRAQRALAAAQSKHQAGAPEAARRLLGMAQAGPLGEFGRARAELLRAQMAADADGGHGAPSLLEAAKRLEPLHPGLARETYGDAFGAALAAGRLARFGAIPEVGAAALAAPPAPRPPDGPDVRGPDLLLDGLAVLTTRGYAAGAPILRRALSAWPEAEGPVSESPVSEGWRWLPLACRISHDVWDDQSWSALTTRLIRLARRAGALRVLPAALLSGLALRLLAGEVTLATAMAAEMEAIAQATGNPVGPYGPLLLAAWQGREAEAGQLIAATTAEMVARGEGRWLTIATWATAVLSNGLGRYDEALAAAEQGTGYPCELGLAARSTAELIEAAARAGVPGRAAGAMARLTEITTASGTDWALGIQARSRALLSDGESAERLYLEAIQRLGRTRIRAELARAYLLYGEWLRRQNRRTDAREQLRVAHQMLTEMGFCGFAERARRELLATGETVRKRTLEAAAELTAQEAQIARLAGEGHTNTAIGGRLFISGRTVEWHLHKIFAKLGISSRKELREALTELGPVALPA